MKTAISAQPPAIAVSVKRAAEMLSLSHWTIRAHAKSGRLRTARFGRRVLVPLTDLEQLVRDHMK
jgi:excisionase family DNA binding protein